MISPSHIFQMQLNEKIFKGLQVGEEDRKMYEKILAGTSEHKEDKVIQHFMDHYVYPLNERLQSAVEMVLLDSLTGSLPEVQATKNMIGFQSVSRAYVNSLTKSYMTVTDLVFGSFFDRYEIKSSELVKALKSEVYEEFRTFTRGTMANTEQSILKYVRTLQREAIQRNLHVKRLKQMDVLDEVIDREIKTFKDRMLKKYPDIRKALENGQILKSRTYINSRGESTYRTFTLDEYAEMSVQRTLLNLDNTAAQIDAEQNNERVVEYYLRDNRVLKTDPFEFCQKILNHKIRGKSLLALDADAANLLAIMTVSKAREQGAMSIKRKCRHAIRRITDKNYLAMINKILYVGSIGGDRTGEPEPVEV